LVGTLVELAISSSFDQHRVQDPWRHPALFAFGRVLNFSLRLAAFVHDLAFHCARRGQMEAQKWIAEHSEWRVERWSCQPYGKLRFKI
jgi:hypothetical protein